MIRYRVDPALHIHFDFDETTGERRLLIDHLRHATRFELLSSAALRALDEARVPRSEDEYLARLESLGLSPERAQRFFEEAVAHGMLEAIDEVSSERHDLEWKLRMAKAHQPYLDYRTEDGCKAEEDLMIAYREEEPPPCIYKDYPDAPRVALDDSSLARVLRHAFAATGTIEDPVQGRLLLKTYPSGGARHPLECYVVSRGLFHYSVRHDALELLDESVNPGEGLVFQFILTARPERVMWRYREPTSFGVMMLDAGHAIENFRWACRTEGLSCSVSLDIDDTPVPLTQYEELPLALIEVSG